MVAVQSSRRKERKKEEAIVITKKGSHGHSLTPLDDVQDRGWARAPLMILRPIVWADIKRIIPNYILGLSLYNNMTREGKERTNEPNFEFSPFLAMDNLYEIQEL